jgi:hypothetical protein
MKTRPDITGAKLVGTDSETGGPVYRAQYREYSDAPYAPCDSCADAGLLEDATTTRGRWAFCTACAAVHDRDQREKRFRASH